MNIDETTQAEPQESRAEVLQYLDIMRSAAQMGFVEDANAAVLNLIQKVEPALRFLYAGRPESVVVAEERERIEVALSDLPTTRTQAWLKGWDSIALSAALEVVRGEQVSA